MGGNIHLTLRDTDDNLYHMERWTNPLPGFVQNILVADNIQSELDNYMHSWFNMRKDYEANKDTGNFTYLMTDLYFPSPDSLNESEYGSVYLDLKNKILVSDNTYSDMNKIMGIELSTNPQEVAEILRKATHKGALYYTPMTRNNYGETVAVTDVKDQLYTLCHAIIDERMSADRMTDVFEIRPEGWYVYTGMSGSFENWRKQVNLALAEGGLEPF